MASDTHARTQREIASTVCPSVDTAPNTVLSLSDNKNNKLPNAVIQGGKENVLVSGKEMLISQTYDPDTYDPDGRMPWTPEPEPYDPETYEAWGRQHFGEDWYE